MVYAEIEDSICKQLNIFDVHIACCMRLQCELALNLLPS